jgi:ABC-type branched-subunit amino acid transport system substrate-binding protein
MRRAFLFACLCPFVLVTFLAARPRAHAAQAPEGCAGDLSGERIAFYHFGDLSGPFSPLTLPVLAGFEDAIAYFNSQGGLCGAEVAMEYRDTGGRQEAAQAAWDEFSAQDDITIMFVYLTEDAELLRDQAEERRLPLVVSSGSVAALYGESADDPAWVFSVTPLYADQLGAFCDYVADNWDSFGIAGPPVLGHVSFLGALGQSSDTPEARAYCQAQGIGYAGAQYYFPTLSDISTQLNEVLRTGANIIYTTSVASGPAQVATTLEALGLRQQVLLGGPNIVLDTTTITLGGRAVEGILGHLPYLWWDEIGNVGIQTMTDYWTENRLNTASDPAQAYGLRNVAYLVAWGAVDLYIELMRETINRVGLANINGVQMFKTMTGGQTYSALDGVITIDYAGEKRAPRQTRLGSIRFIEKDGVLTPQILPLTDFFEAPDLRPAGRDVVK